MRKKSKRLIIFLTTLILMIGLVVFGIVYSGNHNSNNKEKDADTSYDINDQTKYASNLSFKPSADGTYVIFKGLDSGKSFDTNHPTLYIPNTYIVNGKALPVKEINIDVSETNGVKYSDMANYHPEYITALVIPNSVEKISYGAFAGFYNVQYVQTPFVGLSRTAVSTDLRPASGSSDWSGLDINGNYAAQSAFLSIFGDSNFFDIEHADNASWYYSPSFISSSGSSSSYLLLMNPVSLNKIVITDAVYIDTHAFFNVTNVKEIDITWKTTGITSEEEAIFGKIGEYAFNSCIDVETINLPTSISYLGIGVFGNCQNLLNINLPNTISSIPEATFEECFSLKEIIIPYTVTFIGAHAFSDCSALTRVYPSNHGYQTDKPSASNYVAEGDCYLPDSLTSIGSQAFRTCLQIKNIVVPTNVNSIGYMAFGSCNNLTSITLPFVGSEAGNSGVEESLFGFVFGKYGYYGDIFNENGLAQSDGIFQSADGILTSATEEGGYYFIPNSLRTVTITKETVIGSGAFMNCGMIVTLVLPDTLTSVAKGSLNGCSELYSLTIPFIGPNDSATAEEGGQLGYIFGTTSYGSANSTFGNATHNSTAITTNQSYATYYLPYNLKVLSITKQSTIRSHAFYNVTTVTDLTIGDYTSYIERSIFTGCINLEKLTLPFVGCQQGQFYISYWWSPDINVRNSLVWLFSHSSGSSSYEVAFIFYQRNSYSSYVPNSLKEVVITNDTYIDSCAFKYFSSLESITINDEVSFIESEALKGCSGLTHLSLPFIGASANSGNKNEFQYTIGWLFGSGTYANSYAAYQYDRYVYIPSNLSSIYIDEKITMIAHSAFRGMTSLESVQSNAVIGTLGAYSFANCTNLSIVDLPRATYTAVGNYAFLNDRALTNAIDQETGNYIDYKYSFIPDTVTKIGEGGLMGTSILNVDLTKYTHVGNYAFADCLQITEIDFTGSELSTVGSYLFSGCKNLSDVTLTKYLSKYMFKDCISLFTIDLTNVAPIVKEIPDGCFYGCTNLQSYDSTTKTGLILNANSSQVARIGAFAFKGCSSITSFLLPESLVEIGAGAFQDCTGLECLTIPRTVDSIYLGTDLSTGKDDLANGPFYGCKDDFYLSVYYSQDEWPSNWGNNWNCYYPVYIIGDSTTSMFTYEYNTTLKGYLITGLDTENYAFYDAIGNLTVTGTVSFPSYYNGLTVYGIASSFGGNGVIKELAKVDNYVIPSGYVYLGEEALNVRQNAPIDIYMSVTTTQAAKLNDEANLRNLHFENEEAYAAPFSRIYYKEAWQLRGTTPVWKTSVLSLVLDDLLTTTYTYTYKLGEAITPKITSAIANPNIVHYTFQEGGLDGIYTDEIRGLFLDDNGEFDFSSFTLEYKNNINVGTATITIYPNDSRFAGTTTVDFIIDQYELDLFYDSDNKEGILDELGRDLLTAYGTQDTNPSSYKRASLASYTGSNWTMSKWIANSNLHYLPTGYSFTGTLQTTGSDSGIYYQTKTNEYEAYKDGYFTWKTPYRVYDANSKDVTSNFKVAITMMVYIVPFEIKEVVWDGEYNNSTGLYEYEYTGTAIVPKPMVYNSDHKLMNPKFQVFVTQAGNQAQAIYPSDTTQYVATITSFDEKNFKWTLSKSEKSITFKVLKANVLISMTVINYVIPEADDYFYFTFSDSNFESWQEYKTKYNMSITGLGPNSRISGTLASSGWTKGEYISSNLTGNTFGWLDTPKVYSTTISTTEEDGTITYVDESAYYNIDLKLYVSIIYNTFDYELQLDGTYVMDVPGVNKDLSNDTYICYGADGYSHTLGVNVKNTNNANVTFEHDNLSSNSFQFTKIGTYSITLSLSKAKFDDVNKTITLEVGKGNYEFDDLTKEYDREAIDPIKALIRKPIDFDSSELVFTYYLVTDLKNPLNSAPSEIGNYVVEVYTVNSDGTSSPHSAWFNDISKSSPLVIKFSITKRSILIDVADSSGNYSKMYDAEAWKATWIDLTGSTYNLLDGDILNGSASSKSADIGTYSGSVNGDFIVNPGWSVTNDALGEQSKYYKIVFVGTYTITPRVMSVTSSGTEVTYDGRYYSIDVDVLVPLTGYTIYYSEVKLTEESDKDDNLWSIYPFYYNTPGEYTVYFKVVAPTYENYYWSEKVIIHGKTIDYDFNNEEVMYDGYLHGITGTVNDPWSAIVSFCYITGDLGNVNLENLAYSTDCPMFTEIGVYNYAIKIEAPNYDTVYLSSSLTITENSNDINATVVGFEGTYDAAYHEPIISGIPSGTELYYYEGSVSNRNEDKDIKWSTSPFSYLEPGEYTVTVKLMCKNYNVSYHVVSIIIHEIFDSNYAAGENYNLVVDGYNADFDGKYHTVTITSDSSTYLSYDSATGNYYYNVILGSNTVASSIPVTVYYSSVNNYGNEASSTWSTNVLKYKDVGSYMVYVMLKAEHCETKFGHAQITITKANTPPTVTLEDFEFEYAARAIYNEEVPITTVHDGNRIYTYWAYEENNGSYSLVNTIIPNPTDLGHYRVKVQFLESNNCKATTVMVDFDIVPRALIIEYEKELEYIGQEQYPTFKAVTNTTDTVLLDFTLDNPSIVPINIGSYTGTLSMTYENVNYYIKDPNVAFDIIPKKLYIKFEEEMDYDGSSKWTKTSNWDVEGLLLNDTFNASMESYSYVRGTYTLVGVFSYGSGSTTGYINNLDRTTTTGTFVNATSIDVLNSSGNVADYYEIHCDIIVKIVYPQLEVSVENLEVKYDGNTHGLKVNVLSPGVPYITSMFWMSGSDESSATPTLTRINAGTYDISYRISSPNYEDTVGKATLTILPADLSIEIDDFDETYDATAHNVTYQITNENFNIKRFTGKPIITYIDIEDFKDKGYTYDDLVKFFESGCLKTDPIYKIWNSSPTTLVNASTYYACVYFTSDFNWNTSYQIKEVTLKQRALYFNYTGTIVPLVLNKVYDGKKYSISLTDFEYDTLSTANAKSNTGLISGHTINNSNMLNYTIQTKSANARGESGNGDPYQANGDFEFGKMLISDSSHNNVYKNYYPVINERNGDYAVKVIIKRADLTQFDVSDSVVEYSGYDGLPNIETPSDGELVYWYQITDEKFNSVSSTLYNTMTDVGYYIIYISIKQGTNYKAWQGDYDRIIDGYYCKLAYVQIIPKDVEVTWDSLEETYSGEAYYPTGYITDVYGNLVKVDVNIYDSKANLLTTEYVKYAGVYSLDAFITNANYNITNHLENFNILKKTYTITENTKEAFLYNNWSKSYTVDDFTSDDNPWLEGHTLSNLTVTTKGSPPTAGVYNNMAQFTVNQVILDSDGFDVSSSFYFQLDMKVILEFKSIIVAANDTSIYYDNQNHFADIKVTSHSSGYSLLYSVVDYNTFIGNSFNPDNLTYTASVPVFSDVCHYIVFYKATVGATDATDSSQGSTASGYVEFEILQTQSYINFSTSLDKVYDGQGIDVAGLEKSGGWNGTTSDLIYTWYDEGGTNLLDASAPNVAPYEAGVYTLKVTSSRDGQASYVKNYSPLDANFKVTISTRQVNLIINTVYEVDDTKLKAGVWDALDNVELLNNSLSGGKEDVYATNLIVSNALVFSLTSNKIYTRGTYSYINGNNLLYDADTEHGESLVFGGVTNNLFNLTWDLYNLNSSTEVNYNSSVTKNYELKIDFNLVVRYQLMDVTTEDTTYSYILNTFYSPTVSVKDKLTSTVYNLPDDSCNYKITYLNKSTGKYDLTSYKKTYPGRYQIAFKIVYDGSDQQYEDYTGKVTMTIEYRDRTYNSDSASLNLTKYYDAKPVVMPSDSSIFTITDEAIPDPSSWTIQYYKAENDNGASDWYTVGQPLEEAIEAGDYIYILTVPKIGENGTYGETVIQKYFKINLRPFDISGDAGTAGYTGSSWQYDMAKNEKGLTISGLVNDGTNIHKISSGIISSSKTTVGQYSPTSLDGKFIEAYTRFIILDQNGNDVTINYTFTISVTMEITRGQISITMDIPTCGYYTYDGNIKTPIATVTNPVSGYDYVKYSVDGNTWVDNPINFIQVGKGYTIYVKVSAEPNYEQLISHFTFDIVQAQNEVTIDSLTREYNGQAISLPTIHTLDGYNQAANANWVYYINRDTGAQLTTRPTEVGNYTVRVAYPETSNYQGIEVEKDFEITPCILTLNFEELTLIYNATNQSPSYSFRSSTYPNWEINSVFVQGSNYSVEYYDIDKATSLGQTAPTNIGNYKMIISFIGDSAKNFVFADGSTTQNTNFRIDKATIKVSYAGTKAYDALNPIKLIKDTDFTVSGLPDGTEFISSLYTISGEQASYSITGTFLSTNFTSKFNWDSGATKPTILLSDGSADDLNNYNIEVDIKLTVSAGAVTYNVSKYSGEYDGLAHTFTFELTMPEDPNDANIKVEYSVDGGLSYGSFASAAGVSSDGKPLYVAAMSQAVHVVVKVTSAVYGVVILGNDQADALYDEFSILITKKVTSLDTSKVNLDKVYDDVILENPYDDINYTDKDIVNRDSSLVFTYYMLDVSSMGGGTYVQVPIQSVLGVGKYKLQIYMKETKNYLGTESNPITIEFEITAREVVLTLHNQTKVYDGYMWTCVVDSSTNTGPVVSGNKKAESGLVSGHILRGTIETVSANAGFYKIDPDDFEWLSAYQILNGNIDTTANYKITLDLEVTISKANFDVVSHPGAGIYDGITQYFISIEWLSNPIVTTNNLNDLIWYKDAEMSDYTQTPIGKTGGTWTIYFKIEAPNYNTYYSSEQIVISPINSSIQAITYETSKVYDGVMYDGVTKLVLSNGNDRTPTYVYYTADGVEIGAAPTNAGNYYFMVIVEETDSSGAINAGPYYFSITPREIEIDWVTEKEVVDSSGNKIYQFVYTGGQVTPSATATGVLNENIPLSVAVTNPTSGESILVSKGYTAQASIAQSLLANNYRISNDTIEFEIVKRVAGTDPDSPDINYAGIVFYPPTDNVIYGENIEITGIVTNADGSTSTYIFTIDKDGNLVSLVNKDTGEQLPYDNLDFVFNVPKQQVPSIDITISLKDPQNTAWDKTGDTSDKIITVPIESKPLDPDHSKPAPDSPNPDVPVMMPEIMIYEDSWSTTQYYNDGNPVTFTIIVAITGYTIDRSDDIILVEGVDYEIIWFNNINVTPDNATASQMASFVVKSLPTSNYSFSIGDTQSDAPTDVAGRFTILQTEPDRLTLAGDAKVSFVEVTQDFEANTVTFEDRTSSERADILNVIGDSILEAKYSIRLGHLYQGTLISQIIAQFVNDKTLIKVYGSDDVLIEDYTQIIATGMKVCLVDSEGNTVDVVELLLIGDVDGDGSITVNDKVQLIEYINRDSSMDDDDRGTSLYQAGLIAKQNSKITITDTISIINHINGTSTGTNDINGDYKTS